LARWHVQLVRQRRRFTERIPDWKTFSLTERNGGGVRATGAGSATAVSSILIRFAKGGSASVESALTRFAAGGFASVDSSLARFATLGFADEDFDSMVLCMTVCFRGYFLGRPRPRGAAHGFSQLSGGRRLGRALTVRFGYSWVVNEAGRCASVGIGHLFFLAD
jgi:hypothetical protein